MTTTLMLDARARAEAFRDDNKGAVMITGLFMSFFLVGALWYVIGVGDAIIFRDRMQEAADHAVFSSAAIHAKGMNFISVCNMIMLILVAVHIVLGIIQDLTILTCLAAGIGCLWCLAACPRIPGAVMTFRNWSPRVKTALTAMANIETGIAIGAPWIGTARGYAVGSEYTQGSGRVQGNIMVVTMGTSNIPGLTGGSGVIGSSSSLPVGLPVAGKSFSFLCKFIGAELFRVIGGWLPGGLKSVTDLIGGIVGTALQWRYCNDMGSGSALADAQRARLNQAQEELRTGSRGDQVRAEQQRQQAQQTGQPVQGQLPGMNPIDPNANLGGADAQARNQNIPVNGWQQSFDPGFDRGWGDPGVLVVAPTQGNGKDGHQIWGMAINPKYRDVSEKPVSIAGGLKARSFASDSDQGAIGWFAQAEFYYDCGETWDNDDCNGADNFASFGIRWRARIRQLKLPNLLGILGQFAGNRASAALGNAINGALSGNPVGQLLSQSLVGTVVIDQVAGAIDGVAQGLLGNVVDMVNGIQPTGIGGAYH